MGEICGATPNEYLDHWEHYPCEHFKRHPGDHFTSYPYGTCGISWPNNGEGE